MLYKYPSADYPYVWNKGIWRVVLTSSNKIWIFNFGVYKASYPFQLKESTDISPLPKYVRKMIEAAKKIREEMYAAQNNR